MRPKKTDERKMKFDVIIIGGGAAGISAALWCDELGLNALLLESAAELGGQLLWTFNEIKNHLGIEVANGRALRDVFLEQIEKRQFVTQLNAKVSRIDFDKKEVELAGGENFSASFIIIAAGIRRRKLNVEGEEKFKNEGIVESGKRDAEKLKNKEVCVVGGGDAAFENALILAETAAKITLVHRGEKFRARREFVERAEANQKINILTETVVKKIIGDERVEAIELENTKTKKLFKIDVQAIVVRIGVEPNTEFLDGKIALDENRYVKINQNCETEVEGIFAVGDVANPLAPTVSSAVGMGATAVKVIRSKVQSPESKGENRF